MRNGPFEGDFALMFSFLFSCFRLLFFFSKVFFFFFLVCLSTRFHCWHYKQRLTVDVSSVVGSPWRCGVLMT